jgi:hypothetical protein
MKSVIPASARSPEVELILASACIATNPQTMADIPVLASQVSNWPHLLSIAAEHGVRPLLYHNLHRLCPELVPEIASQSLREFAVGNASENLLLSAELLDLLTGLRSRRVAAVPFKGPVLGRWAYGDLGLRECSDLDIVVSKQSLNDAILFLLDRGYGPVRPEAETTTATATQQIAGRYNIFRHSASLTTIDLQASLEAPHFSFPIDDPEIWNRTTLQSFADRTVLNFSVEDTLLLLSVHGAKDMWSRLKWICDIAEFVKHHPLLVWDLALNEAKRLGVKRKFLLALYLADNILGTPLPENVRHLASRDRTVALCAETIGNRLFNPGHEIQESERAAFYFRITDTSWHRARLYLRYAALYLRVIFVPSEHDRSSGPARGLSPMDYLLRPIRLVARYGMKPGLALQVFREWFRSLK